MTENKAINYLRQIDPKHIECVELIDMKEVWESISQAVSVAEKALREIQQYRAIGTVEECQEARERQRTKKRVLDSYFGFDSYECPVCGTEPVGGSNYCHKCGQRLE